MSFNDNLNPQAEVRLAESYGFISELDSRRGGEWCNFAKGNNHVWQIVKSGIGVFFQTAYMDENDCYTQHKYFETLEEALQHCANRE